MRLPAFIRTRRGKLYLSDVRTIRTRFVRYLRPHWKGLLAAVTVSLGAVAMHVAGPWPIKLVFDVVLSRAMSASRTGQWFALHAPEPVRALILICALILLIALAEAVFCYLRDVLLASIGQSVVGKLRQSLFRHMQKLSPDVFESRRTGDLLMRLTGDIQMLRQLIVDAWITATENLLTIVCTVGIMFWLNPMLAGVAVVTMPFIAWCTAHTSRRLRDVAESQREKESFVASIAHEVLGAIAVVQAFNREKIEAERFARQNRSSLRAGLRATRLEAKLFRIVSLSTAAAMCAVLFLGVRSVLSGAMTAGDLLVFVAYVRVVNKPLRKLSKLAGQTAKATTCGLRIAEILQIPPTIRDAPDALVARDVLGRIELQGVGFVYPDGTRALRDISLRIEPGRRVAVVGRSGAGKSTLMKLLLRFYDPSEGAICVDGTDIRRFTVASLRDQIAVVQQETILFGLTVAENIALGCEGADPESVQAAARQVGAHEFIMALPAGYDTTLSERGTTLSGGQRQRIALARALVRRSPILILDEPVSGLDAELALLAEEAWMTHGAGRTAIVICHHFYSMDRYDKIVVLDAGRVVDSGAHAQLLQGCATYADLYRAWLARSGKPGSSEEDLHAEQPHTVAC